MELLSVPGEAAKSPATFASWLERLLWQMRPESFYLDSFPAGLFGELRAIELPPELRIHHMARLLRWENYLPLLGENTPRLHEVYQLEPLAAEHRHWLQEHANQLSELTLPIARPASLPGEAAAFSALPRPRWLMVHSGPWGEVEELLAYARDIAAAEDQQPSWVLVTPRKKQPLTTDVLHLPLYPASPLYPLADRIISACGFNLMRETAPVRHKHRFLPMTRRFDDQFARAARSRQTALKGPGSLYYT